MYDKYGEKFGGIFIWEYYNTLPTPLEWCKFVGLYLIIINKVMFAEFIDNSQLNMVLLKNIFTKKCNIIII